ncbi:reverse transcriptase domain-containing protein [Tanacetum coccineum]
MSGQGGCCPKSSVSKMLEGRAKAEWKTGKLEHAEEAESVFKQMKQLVAKFPMLTASEEKKELIVYLAAAKEAPRLERSRSELHINGKIGSGTGTCQQASEKILPSTLNYSCHGLTHKASIAKTESSMKSTKWSIELGKYVIHYRPRVSVKGQILADFIVEHPEEDSLDTLIEVEEELLEPWILFTDGTSCADGSRAGLILTNPEGTEFTYALRFGFEATNNEAEYEALIAGLRIAEQMSVKNLQENVDSRMFSIKQVSRSKNKKADALSKIASTSFAHLSKQVLVEELKEKSINEMEVLAVVEEEGDTWMTPIYKYLTEETLPAEVNEARAVRRKSQRFAVVNRVLYKKSFLGPWLRCVGPLQANYVLKEIHEGSCSMHAGTRFVVFKALRTEYY